MVAEQAGGAATTGTRSVLEVTPQATHQRIPFAIGSRREIAKYENAHRRRGFKAALSEWFGGRTALGNARCRRTRRCALALSTLQGIRRGPGAGGSDPRGVARATAFRGTAMTTSLNTTPFTELHSAGGRRHFHR